MAMHRFRLPALLPFVFGLASACGQQVAPQAAPASGNLKLNVVVTEGNNGKPVAALPRSLFSVLDNGASQPIQGFRAVTGKAEPVKILIVIDAVNLDFQHVAYERQQIERFLRANDGQLSQPTALGIFTDKGVQVQPGFSTDGNGLAASLDKQIIGLRELRRSSGFYGAEERLDLSLRATDQLLARAASEPGRKFIIWVSPGWPLLTGPNIQLSNRDEQHLFNEVIAFSDALRRANTTMYVVDPLGAGEGPGRTFYYQQFVKGVRKPSQAVPGDLGVQVFAEQSGGLFLSGNNDLRVLFERCYADASFFYEISYQPPPGETGPEYHHIEVRVAEPHMVARTLQGYYTHP